jgi:hypothetical protein
VHTTADVEFRNSPLTMSPLKKQCTISRFLNPSSAGGCATEPHSAKKETADFAAPLDKSTLRLYGCVISFKRRPPQVSKSNCGGEVGERHGLKFVLQRDPGAFPPKEEDPGRHLVRPQQDRQAACGARNYHDGLSDDYVS